MTAKRSPLRWLVPIALIAAAPFVWSKINNSGAEESGPTQGAVAQFGDLRITVMERGNLEAAESVTLKSEIEGQSTVLWLIDEGVHVVPGDLLCELDTASLEDRRVQQEIKVQNAEATLIKAEQNYAIQVSQNQSDIAMAQQDLDFAKLDLEKYRDGDMPQERQKKDEDILIADEELTRAKQDLAWSERLAEKGFLEQSQLDADRLSKTRAEVTLNQAERAKELFVNYEIPRRETELQAAVEEADRELVRVKLQAKARIADFEADKLSAQATANLERDDLKKIVSQVAKGKIKAPVAGMVVYARERSRWGSGEPMEEGASVRERQDIVTIPSSEGFTADVSLHESVLEKVQVGMECLVTIDALGAAFPGKVTFKAVLPDQNSYWANPDTRVYRTVVKLTKPDPRMRPGMSCSVEILVDDLHDVTYIPVQSVFLDGGAPVAFVAGAGNPTKRPVVVGQNDGKWVEISDGVKAGETVLLSPPAGVELAPAKDTSRGGGPPAGVGEQGGGMGGDGERKGDRGGMGGEKPSGKGGGKASGKGGETSTAQGGASRRGDRDAD